MENTEGNIITDQAQIATTLVDHFTKKFEYQNVTIHEKIMEAIPKLLNEDDNFFLDVVPTAIEIKEAVFNLIEAIQYFWSHRFIPKGLNSNFLFLLPKIQGARRAEKFRPIGLANFIFKIFTRILTTRISSLIGRLISPQQGASIKGRNIHDKIVLASEMINELNIKRRGGNVGLKLDITQEFDSLSWEFLFEVLRRFGFSEVSINWIRKIFESAMIFVLVNGGPCEEVLSRNISNLIQEGKIQAMVTRGGSSDTRKNRIADYLLMGLSELPDTYLGVILCPGSVKTYQVWGMVELMQKMLAGWIVKKLITVKWDELNAPITESGLRLRRLEVMNKSLLMKLLWKIETEDVEWTNFMRAKYKNKNNEWTTTYRQSSIWPGLKWVIPEINNNKRWSVGDGKSISVCKDKWVKDYTLIDRYVDDQFFISNINMKVIDFIVDGIWKIPLQMFKYFEKNEVPTIGDGPDKLIWENDLNGKFSVASATHQIRKKFPVTSWSKKIWDPSVHPYTSTNLWKIACATEEVVRKKGFSTVSKCYLCGNAQDAMTHILWKCSFSTQVWHWLGATKMTDIKKCFFKLPEKGQVLICCDGALKGNPGNAGPGFIARDDSGGCLGDASGGLGIATNYLEEVMALIVAGEWAVKKQYKKVVELVRFLGYEDDNGISDKLDITARVSQG
ncbi:uncharacterized protein LOC113333563 [Papaver somniferum]|uniref:uncharacterized protein LOC113333563 n=1 Tax=Papaver somniferum TaxID=3469 RepID=UPI000E6F5F09|nr:uncharacterized protein LOC113333563 [Papaver somniferum]